VSFLDGNGYKVVFAENMSENDQKRFKDMVNSSSKLQEYYDELDSKEEVYTLSWKKRT